MMLSQRVFYTRGCGRIFVNGGLGGRRCFASSKLSSPVRAAAVSGMDIGPAAPKISARQGNQDRLVHPSNVAGMIKMYAQLSKYKLSAFVVLSSSAGFILAGAPIAVGPLAAVTVGTALQSGAANTFNQLYEIKTDALMKRTCARPLPSGRITKAHAFGFGVTNALAGTALLYTVCNPLTAALGAANIFLYSCVYTPMKQMSIYNTWVGALVGAIPPLMGYAAATGTIASAEAAILGTGLLLWQFPHFFALAWLGKRDYTAGGHKMVPCFDPKGIATGKLLTKYSLALSTLPLASYSLGITSAMFPLESLFFNGYLVHSCYKFRADPTMGNARRVFHSSLWYLPVFMGLLIFHKNDWADPDGRSSLVFSNPNRVVPLAAAEMTQTSEFSSDVMKQVYESSTIEGAIKCAKTYMKSKCIHEILMVPPLARIQDGNVEEQTAKCPVSMSR
mmetsp:Transcript_17964/g.29141  ORF Transcript_17964/g.29141 Transcript_17964/m.29141 type:complete len:448 (-) Transcript_17964:3122-4465(-)